MVFSSLFFVYMFFALNLATVLLIPSTKAKNVVMLIFSLIFYAFAGPKYLLLLLGLTFVSWFCARMIENNESRTARLVWLVTDIVVLLGTLCIFKYTGFFLGNLKLLTGFPQELPKIVLPIGISFYTFQLLSYVVDVYRKDVAAQKNYFWLLLYTSMFHQCIAGPIVRYETVANEIEHRKVYGGEIAQGILRFSIGLTKKAVLANTCARIIRDLVPATGTALSTTPTLNLWLGMFCFMLQIYLDFSAYSDMAIGMGQMIGFHYDENFNYPYVASSVTAFWRRWHISLSSFFRDYVYIPLGGNRVNIGRHIFNLFVVWGLTGFWHGASWNFILWGLYYFVLLVLEKFIFLKLKDKLPTALKWISHVITLFLVYVGWVIFYFDDMTNLGIALKNMFRIGIDKSAVAISTLQTSLAFKSNIFILIIAILACLPIYKSIHEALEESGKTSASARVIGGVLDILTVIFCLVISTMALVGNSYNPFLYFRF